MKKLEERLSFESSHGTIVCNGLGDIVKKESDMSDWLLTVKKIDVEELNHYYKLNNIGSSCEGGDVLDFGYWDNDGNYNKPEKSWRLSNFHNQGVTLNKEVVSIVESSFVWIADNRVINP